MSHAELDPMDEQMEPLAQAIGRAVLGAAALEKVLLVDIAQRQAEREGLTEELGEMLARLEQKPAGVLLEKLRGLGISDDLAEGIEAAIGRRNHLVHHFMEDPEVISFFATAEGVGQLVDRVDELAAECQRLINEIAPVAFSAAAEAIGVPLADLMEAMRSVEPDRVEDERLRGHWRRRRQWREPFRAGASSYSAR